MTEPGLVSLLTEFYSNWGRNNSSEVIMIGGIITLLSTFSQGSPFGIQDWYESRKPQEECLRKVLDHAGLRQFTNDYFYDLTRLPSRRVRLKSLSKILHNASAMNDYQKIQGLQPTQVEPQYQSFVEKLREHPYEQAIEHLLSTDDVRETIRVRDTISSILDTTIFHPFLTSLYVAALGMAAVVNYEAPHYVSDSWPHELYFNATMGALGTGAIAGLATISIPKLAKLVPSGTTPVRKAFNHLVGGALVALLCINAYIKSASHQSFEENKKAVLSHVSSDSTSLFIAYRNGREICQSSDEKDTSVCVIQKEGYFAQVDTFKINPGGNIELVR